MSYRGASEIFLKSAGISIGDSVKITKPHISYEGMLLDRAEDADERHLVLKLKNGYNIGVDIDNAIVELIEKGEKPKIELSKLDIEEDSSKQDISIISTGGTVASVIDYKTGAVHPAFTADDLIRANPELLEHANIKGKAVLNILSENSLEIKSVLNVTCNFLYELWKTPILTQQRDILIFSVFDKITENRNRDQIFSELSSLINNKFLLLPFAEEQITSLIKIWKRIHVT